jgi:GTP-binding protein Era
MVEAPRRCGFLAILGAPNVGKSTLLNRLVGTKVSIVTSKVQTTRRRVLGITVRGDAQLIFIDTPGIFEPRPGRRLELAMVHAAWRGAEDADQRILVVDANRGLDADTARVLEGLRERGDRAIVAINKLDLVAPTAVLPLIQKFDQTGLFDRVFIISALEGDGCEDLLNAMAAELTREQLFRQLHQELPYSLTVETESWVASRDGSEVRIDQTIYVQRDTQKAIVLGKGGQQIKAVGEAARHELEAMLGQRVHLFLFVKVRRRWLEDPERFQELGLDFPS